MSIRETIFECPGYKVVECQSQMGDSTLVMLKPGQKYACMLPGKKYYKMFTAGSLLSSFVNADYVKPGWTFEDEVERDLKNGGSEYWLNQNGTMISDHKPDHKPVYQLIEVGARIIMHGQIMKIGVANNDNLSLTKCK